MTDAEKIGPALAAERDARMTRWLAYVEAIKLEVWSLHHHRSLFCQMTDVLFQASGDQTFFLEHYWHLYHERQMIAVRRLVDQDPRTVSMTRLLTELAEHPETMTRTVHLKMWNITDDEHGLWEKEANEAFGRYADGDGYNVDLRQSGATSPSGGQTRSR